MHIYAIGTMPKWADVLIQDYQARLPSKGFWALDVVSLRAPKASKSKETKKKETQLLMGNLAQNEHTILLDAKGTSMSSQRFASKLVSYQKNLAFVVGGADGVERTLCTVDECWSLSSMTLTHVFARLLLVEQIYRAYAIQTHHPYHK